jgi:protoporphyrin/coproporphyrin ferrochelatase
MVNGVSSVSEPSGVLLMAYGTPATLADVEAYYTHIRRGRPPEPAQLAELIGRYRAIGGSSPLLEVSRAQADGLQEELNAAGEGRFHVELGMKHAPPFIEDGVQALIAAGAQRVLALVLAPHYSPLSVGEYIARARAAAGERLALAFVEHWHLEPSYITLLADRVRAAVGSFPAEAREQLDVIFTAHSLPSRILASDDPYPRQLCETAAAVARSLGLTRWSIAWQSAGRTSEQWLGPDVLQVVRELAGTGSRGAIVCPAGFTSDHLEILYDLDVECRALAVQLGLDWRRTESLNADPAFLRVLADLVLDRSRVTA